MPFVVAVEDEEGCFLVEGPFASMDDAEARAEVYKHSLRLAAYKAAPADYDHPDDPAVFAWVVPIVPPGSEIDNRFADAPLKLVSTPPEDL